MNKSKMPEDINQGRRRFLETAAIALAAVPLRRMAFADAPGPTDPKTNKPGAKPKANASFGPLKQIDAGVLNIGYAEVGPANGPAVFLLHGWPYDIHSFVEVAPLLAGAGYRVIVPHLRGHARRAFFRAKRSAMPSSRRSL